MVLNAECEKVAIKLPHADAAKRVGWGICERKGPITDQMGICVTSVGPTRTPSNQFSWQNRYWLVFRLQVFVLITCLCGLVLYGPESRERSTSDT